MTDLQLFLLPAFLHVALVMVLVGLTGKGRVEAVKSGEVRLGDIALDSSRWPDRLRKLGNNYQNQFESPVLYYAVLALALAAAKVDAAMIVLSWVFVAARFVHCFIHTGRNNVVRRLIAFTAGLSALALMWIWFAIRLYVAG